MADSGSHQPKKKQDHKALEAQLEQCLADLAAAKENELRARADYNNLQRRTADERLTTIKLATKALATDLLQPLDHLAMAARQLHDPGLDMVIGRLWDTLGEHGLQEIDPIGQPFNHEEMEAAESEQDVDEASAVVTSVLRRGYRLNGEVIQHAKVVVGKKA
jgi:molecular chaperone GrpE